MSKCNCGQGEYHFPDCLVWGSQPKLTPEQVAEWWNDYEHECACETCNNYIIHLRALIRELATGRYSAAEKVALAKAALGERET